jgi:hypothetical protein
MAKRFRAPWIFGVDPTSVSRIRRWMVFGTKLAFWPLALLTLGALALELGAWREEYKIAGPFAAETTPARHSLVLLVPQDTPAMWWVEPLLGDDNEHSQQSVLRLWIDGHEMGPPHSDHEAIRDRRTAGFSHWGPRVIFSLPPGVENVPETTAMLRYRVRPSSWLALALTVSSALFGWFLYARAFRSFARRPGKRPIAVLVRTPYLILLGLCGVGLIGPVSYVVCSLYALATGWALPTTALIRWSPIAQWAAHNEPFLGYLLLMLAGFGASVTWLAGTNAQHRRFVESDELSLRRLLAWCGFPIVACAFVFCTSAMWEGILRPGDLNSFNIGGLVPFSDAANYLAAAHDQAKDGLWNFVALRRPLAAAFRSVLLVFGNFSLQFTLLIQACLIAGAVCFATNAVAKWRGVWAATAFFALTYIYDRNFVPTTLTEPLGLFWALLSIPFYIEAFRDRAVKPALLAFAMTAVALLTRMGSVFTIPALLLWLVWQFGQGAKARLRIFATAICILLGIFGLNSLLQKTYGAGPSPATGNFSYVLCGLTMGTDWGGCLTKLASEGKPFPQGEEARAVLLYSMAWKNFRTEPGVFFGRLTDGAEEFATQFPGVIWKGYGTAIPEPGWLWRNSLVAICLIGLLYAAARARAVELTFWTLLWASIVASSSMVYFEDGARALAASHPLVALFFATGMGNPLLAPRQATSSSHLSRYGSLGLIVAAALFVGVPWMAHRYSPVGAMVGDGLSTKQDEAFVFGGRRMSGFLVVEDGLPLRSDVPSLHLADFDTLVRQSNVEFYQDLIHPILPPLPFGFVFSPRLEKESSSRYQYIVPAEVIERRDVPAWHFHLEQWRYKPGGFDEYWFFVTKAEPLYQ